MEVIIDPVLFCSFQTRQPCWYIIVGVSHKVVISTRFSITKLEIQHRIYKFCIGRCIVTCLNFNKTLLQRCLSFMPFRSFRREGPSLLFSRVCLWPIDNPIIPESDQLQFSPFSILYSIKHFGHENQGIDITILNLIDALYNFSPKEVYKAEQVKNLNFDSSVKELKVSVAIFFSHKCIKYFSYKFFF